MNMPKVTITFAIIFILLGIIGYIATGMVSITALIPSFFGLVLLALGLLAQAESRRKVSMHIAVVFGVLGIAGTFGGLTKLPTYLSGGELARPEAVLTQAIMCLLSLVYVILCIKSFIDARKAAGAQPNES